MSCSSLFVGVVVAIFNVFNNLFFHVVEYDIVVVGIAVVVDVEFVVVVNAIGVVVAIVAVVM